MNEIEKQNLIDSEPETPLLLRTSILSYEVGEVVKNIVYANRFNDKREAYLAYAKSGIHDIIVQAELLCRQLGMNYEQTCDDAWDKLAERFKDFQRDGWSKI